MFFLTSLPTVPCRESSRSREAPCSSFKLIAHPYVQFLAFVRVQVQPKRWGVALGPALKSIYIARNCGGLKYQLQRCKWRRHETQNGLSGKSRAKKQIYDERRIAIYINYLVHKTHRMSCRWNIAMLGSGPTNGRGKHKGLEWNMKICTFTSCFIVSTQRGYFLWSSSNSLLLRKNISPTRWRLWLFRL